LGFKEDADFARFVSMGAAATDAVRAHLRDALGHRVVELERYSMANKVWHTKVKRLRLPDLLCVHCGRRVESRGKSKLGIIVSHSDREGRTWDAGGMGEDDLYAFLRVVVSPGEVRTSIPAYFRTADLLATVDRARRSERKALSEGFELTLIWPTWVPSQSGEVEGIDTEGRIVCRWDSGKTYRYPHWRGWPQRRLYVEPGGRVIGGETIVAGIVEPAVGLRCPGGVWDVQRAMASDDASTRYAAVRAAGLREEAALADAVASVAEDDFEDWRIRLEAAASLARLGREEWTGQIAEVALNRRLDPEQRMEAVFVLSELPVDGAGAALVEIASNRDGDSELRSAAVWGLAQGLNQLPDEVLAFALDEDPLVAAHAVAGMPTLTAANERGLERWLRGSDERRTALGAALLARNGSVTTLLKVANAKGPGRLWALRALGDLPEAVVRERGGKLLTRAIEDALAPFWIGQRDWLRTGGAEAIDALDVQKVRFNPLV
jgi:hypothetical protein